MHGHPSSPKGWGQKKTLRKMENQHFVSPSRHCSSRPVGFGEGFISKEQCDNAEASPWPGSSCCHLFPRLKSALKGREFVMLQSLLRMRRNSWKAFTKCLPRKFSTHLQSLTEVCICLRGLLRRKCSLNNGTVLYFSRIKWFREHSGATTCIARTRFFYTLFLVLETEKLNFP